MPVASFSRLSNILVMITGMTGKAVIGSFASIAKRSLGKRQIVQIQRRALADRLPDLVQAVVEIERQDATDPVVLRRAEVFGNDIRAFGKVPVGNQNSLRLPVEPDE